MRKTFGRQELAVVEMAERVATNHMCLAMGPQGPHPGVHAEYVDFRRNRDNKTISFRIGFHGGLVFDVVAQVLEEARYEVIAPSVQEEYRQQHGIGFKLKSYLSRKSTRPAGYDTVQTGAFLLRNDGHIHPITI